MEVSSSGVEFDCVGVFSRYTEHTYIHAERFMMYVILWHCEVHDLLLLESLEF
jgi:hypothetical protein